MLENNDYHLFYFYDTVSIHYHLTRILSLVPHMNKNSVIEFDKNPNNEIFWCGG